MKLPRIVADNNIPGSIPGGYAGGEAFGVQTAQALQEGAQQVGRAGQRTSDIYAHAAAVLEQAKAKAELDGALTTFKGQSTDAEIALQGTDPDQYPTALRSALKDRATAISDSLTSPLAKSAFASHVNALTETKMSEAKWDAQKMKLGLTKILEDVNQKTDATVAASKSMTPELQPDGTTLPAWQAAFRRGITRGPDGLRNKIYSADEASQMTGSFLAEMEKVEAIKDFENPTLRGRTLATLRSLGGKYMKPEAQLQLADSLEAKEHARDAALRAEEDRVRKEAATQGDKDVTDAIASGDMQKAAGVLQANRRVLEGPRYEHHANKIAKGPVAETDPAVRREIMPEIYNVSGDPRRTDDKLRKYFGQGRVADDDYQKWGGHLETRINRLQAKSEGEANRAEARKDREAQRDESRLKHEEGEAQSALRELTRVTGPAADALNPAAQDALNWGLEDMARNSPLYGKGTERPMEWLERNKVGIMARIGTVASNRLRTIDETAAIKEPDTQGATIQAAERARQRLVERRNDRTLFKDDAAWYDQMRAVEEKVGLIRQLELYGKKPPTPTSGSPTTGPRPALSEPSMKPAGKTGGR